MKLVHLLSLAPAVAALVVPDQQVFQDLASKSEEVYSDAGHRASRLYNGAKSGLDDMIYDLKEKFDSAEEQVESVLDEALHSSSTAGQSWTDEVFDARLWAKERLDHVEEIEADLERWEAHFERMIQCDQSRELLEEPDHPHRPPHHEPEEPPHHRPERPPHHRPGKRPHGPPHGHHRHNATVYQLIAESKYTTKLAKLINEFPDLVDALNGTEANYTIFAPTDRAFAKIPEEAPKPSKEQLKKLLSYHVVPDFYPAGRVLQSHTLPTLFQSEDLAEEAVPQRLSVHIGLPGLTINFYSRIIAIDIIGSNGVIHGVDSIILPPPSALKIISLLPSEFSTLELGLGKTGLVDDLTEPHKGGTLFAPSNFAFSKLGPRLNAFLFSKYGQKYLKALLKYHVVPHTTVYSDAIYSSKSDEEEESSPIHNPLLHLELPTLLEDHALNVDIARWGGFVSIKLNGFVRVVVSDGIAKDGVIHAVSDVLIPPKKVPTSLFERLKHRFVDDELSVEDLMERLEPYLE